MLGEPFRAEFDESSSILVVAGEVDEAALTDLEKVVGHVSHDFTRSVIVDLSGVTLLPSSALGVLTVAMKRGGQSGHAVELLAREDSFARRILQITGLPHRTA